VDTADLGSGIGIARYEKVVALAKHRFTRRQSFTPVMQPGRAVRKLAEEQATLHYCSFSMATIVIYLH